MMSSALSFTAARRLTPRYVAALALYTAGWAWGLAMADGNRGTIRAAVVLGVLISIGLVVAPLRWRRWPRWALLALSAIGMITSLAAAEVSRVPLAVLDVAAVVLVWLDLGRRS
jgi:hypothetical protein